MLLLFFTVCCIIFEILQILQVLQGALHHNHNVCACFQGCQNDITPESIMLLLNLHVQRIVYTVTICFRSTFPCFEAQISEC